MFGKKDNRAHWEVMADDGMNKFPSFVSLHFYGWDTVVIALIDRSP